MKPFLFCKESYNESEIKHSDFVAAFSFCVATSVDIHYCMKMKKAIVTFSLATIKNCGNNIPRSGSPISKTMVVSTCY